MNALRTLGRWLLAVPRWIWAALAVGLGVLELWSVRRELARAKAQREAARDSAAAERLAFERRELAGARQLEAHVVAERVRDAAGDRLAAEAAEIARAEAAGDEALAAEVNETYGGRP